MTESESQPPEESRSKSELDDGLEQLRELLLVSDRQELVELREQVKNIEVSADEVCRVLPEAVVERSLQDNQLAEALAPAVEHSLEASVRRDPSILTNLIFPVIGPAIRKAISHSMVSLTESINRSIEYSLSPKGLRWRFEAWRTGVPFSEIILKHSLILRVEQVFLIHRESAVLLEHVIAPTVAAGDADVVSAMLGAIQDFVSDSFEAGESESISQIEFGERVLEIARSPMVVLACEVRGVSSAVLRVQMQEALEQIHATRGTELRQFDGDVTPFASTRVQLEGLMLEKRAETKKSRYGQVLLASAAILLVALAVIWGLGTYSARQEWQRARAALEAEPGLVVLTESREGGRLSFRGLRDPLASDPLDVLQRAGVQTSKVDGRWAPYHSAELELVLRRFERAFSPPPTASFDLIDQELVLSGQAGYAWISHVREAAPLLPGIESVNLGGLIDTDIQIAGPLIEEIEGLAVPIQAGANELDQDRQEVEVLLRAFREFERMALKTGIQYDLRVLGFAETNDPESLALADASAGSLERLLVESSHEPAGLNFVRTRPAPSSDGAASLRLKIQLKNVATRETEQ